MDEGPGVAAHMGTNGDPSHVVCFNTTPAPSPSENITTIDDQHSRIPPTPTPSLVSSINDSNRVAALPNVVNPIWQQIVDCRIGEIVMALAAAVLSQNKELADLKCGWIAVVLLFGIAMIWNALLFKTHGSFTRPVGMIGIALVIVAVIGSISSYFASTSQSLICWLVCTFMCLPLIRGLVYEIFPYVDEH